ncbi:hypothetical protein GCM10010260_23100 [Streptomyces filipinensis]|uniref:Uncharacterized protein n=1 Tax=Streptomyces filipinensis TaxID=66887 RepID=A0A918IAM6_9ACTN|nr:hypothetical protein GCM10010260_23100 [Streptomyces filipinensis]
MESVDSRDQIRDPGSWLYGRSGFRPDLRTALPGRGTSEKKRSGPGGGMRFRGRTGPAAYVTSYRTSTKSPAALTAGVVEVPAKEKR